MQKYTWRTDPYGLIWVTTGAEPEHVLLLGMKDAAVMDSVIARWEPLAIANEKRASVPRGWILSMIWRESGGNPTARNVENLTVPDDDGVGLCQLTIRYFAGGRSVAQLMEPATNVAIASDHIAQLSKKYAGDFPKVSAAYNAGSVRPSDHNPFGMVSTGNHIEAEVAALNSYITRKLPPEVFQPWRVPSTEEVLAEVAKTSADMLREEDFGARTLDDGSDPLEPHDTIPAPPDVPADRDTEPQTPISKSKPPPAA